MLHPLNPPDRQCEDDLFALIEWQRRVLHYALCHSSFSLTTFEASLGVDFVNWFENCRRNGRRDQQRAFNNFQQNLNDLAKSDPTTKQTILDDFNHDQQFYFCLNNPKFLFAFSPTISTAHDNAKVCLNAFYEFLTWGIPDVLLPSGRSFHRQDIVESYLAQNPFLKFVCPCCDNSWPEPRKAGQTSYTLEHFFHKEEHSSICLHPYNLIPMCSICNGRRGNKEMLSTATGASLTIDSIFHPIDRPARNYAQLEFRSQRLQPDIVYLMNSPARVDNWQTAIDSYETIYEIPSRWKTAWTEIESVASSAIHYALSAITSPVSASQFRQLLETIENDLAETHGRYKYPAGRWLAWAKQNHFDLLYDTQVRARELNLNLNP